MNRRSLLGTIAGVVTTPLLSGCLSAPGTGRGTGTPAGGRRVSIVARDDPPDVPVRPEVEVVAAEATASEPPRLRATVTNVADYPVEVGEERDIVFAFVHSQEVPGVQLLPHPGEYPAVGEGCWRLADAIAVPEYYGIVDLGPGESTSRELGVWGAPELTEGCLPTGRFRFLSTYSVGRDRTEDMDELESSARWGFELRIE